MIFYGLGGIPFSQPKPAPLIVVVGKPIKIPKITNPTPEDISKYHNILINEMRRIFEENKTDRGMGEFTLRIE